MTRCSPGLPVGHPLLDHCSRCLTIKTEPVKTMPCESELLWLSGALWGCSLAGRGTPGWVDEESWCHHVSAGSKPVVSPLPSKMGIELSALWHLWSFAVSITRWSGNSCFGHSLRACSIISVFYLLL